MNIEKIKEAMERHAKKPYVAGADILGGVSDEHIKNAEQQLGFNFCEDYHQFLSRFGCIDARVVMYFGIVMDDSNGLYDCVTYTKEFFEEHYDGGVIPNTTVLTQEDDWEWVVLLNHETGMTTPYDPFSKNLVPEGSRHLEDYLVAEFK